MTRDRQPQPPRRAAAADEQVSDVMLASLADLGIDRSYQTPTLVTWSDRPA